MRPISLFRARSRPMLHAALHATLSVLFALSIAVSALPAATAPAQASTDAFLSFVDVAAPDINCIFDTDCTITVNDLADHFVPPAAAGDAFLQSRLFPRGEAGTQGQDLYAYLYRIDMRNAAGLTAASCVQTMRIEFGPIVPMDYNGDGKVEHAFVVTKGGIGNVRPSAIEQFGSTLLIKFQEPPICVGSSQGNGDSSFFIGFASKTPHRDVTANLTGTLGLSESLDAWAPRLIRELRVRIGESTEKLFRATFELPPVLLLPAKVGRQEFTQFILPYVDPNGHKPGLPDVPVVRRLLAIPRGAKVRVSEIQLGQTQFLQDVLLYPSQPQTPDVALSQRGDEMPTDSFEDGPFVLDADAYKSDKNFPEQWVDVVPMGRMRDLDIVQVSVAAGQYNAANRTLQTAESVSFEIRYEGGEPGFLPRQHADNPFERSFDGLYAQVLNSEILHQYQFGNFVARICWGYEYLIITHPDFRPAADDLRNFKVGIGMSTRVYETGNGSGQIGDSKEEIRDFIRNRFDECAVRPSYVLLLGDAEMVPTFYRMTMYGEDAGTDLDYSLMDNADIMPDLAYGRIPVDTLEQAQQVIDKIIDYEGSPPFDSSFYEDATIASYFQCCRPDVVQDGTASRSFVETSELMRDRLQALGYDVERIYHTSTGYHDDPSEPGYYNTGVRDDTPNRYYNGTLLPVDLRASSGYAWDGDTDDVVDAINDGRFLVLHRDHGFQNGWGDPSFSTGDLADLSNGSLTPVVYSINCASGIFDNETLDIDEQVWPYSDSNSYVSWAEEMLRMEGGAVGIIGDTRVSPTWANSALTRGLFDATWPSVLPLYGGASSIKRLGDILNYGKVYLVGQVGVAQTAGSVGVGDSNTDVVLYHVLGDPTMKMYTSNPRRIFLPKYWYEIEIPKPWEIWKVKYPINGAWMTALQEGNPVARARIVGGEAVLDFIHEVDPDKAIKLSVQHPDGMSVALGGPDTHGLITPKGGGTLTHEDSLFELKFDPGTVMTRTDVLYTTGDISTPLPSELIGLRGFHLEAFDPAITDGTSEPVETSLKPYTMLLGYEDGDLNGAVASEGAAAQAIDENTLGVHYYDEAEGKWKPIECSVNTGANQVSCQADHFAEFALTGRPRIDEPIEPAQTIFLPSVTTAP